MFQKFSMVQHVIIYYIIIYLLYYYLFIILIYNFETVSCTRTNIGKQSVSSFVVDLWQDLSTSLKNLNTFTFPGKVKESLLKTQFSK